MKDLQQFNSIPPASTSKEILFALDKVLREYSFDEIFLTKPELALSALQNATKGILLQTFGLMPELAKSTHIASTNGKVTIVFSKETLKKLQSGEYKLPFDKKSKLLRLDARNTKGQIREIGKVRFDNKRELITSLRSAITATAHCISAIDTQIQLEQITKKLDDIFGFLQADRMGELRGLYANLQKVIAIQDDAVRAQEIRVVIRKLDILEARFYETGLKTIKGIKDPAEITWIESIMTLDDKVEQALKTAIGDAHSDIRAADFCNFLTYNLHAALNDEENLGKVRLVLRKRYEVIRPLFTEKITYIDPKSAKDFNRKTAPILTPKESDLVNEIDFKSEG